MSLLPAMSVASPRSLRAARRRWCIRSSWSIGQPADRCLARWRKHGKRRLVARSAGMNRRSNRNRGAFSTSFARVLCYRRLTPHDREDDHGEESEDESKENQERCKESCGGPQDQEEGRKASSQEAYGEEGVRS